MDCGIPCTPCLVEIINAGIKEIVVTKLQFYDQSSQYLLQHGTLSVRISSHLCEHDNLLQKNQIPFKSTEGYCSDCGMQIEEVS